MMPVKLFHDVSLGLLIEGGAMAYVHGVLVVSDIAICHPDGGQAVPSTGDAVHTIALYGPKICKTKRHIEVGNW